MKKIKFGDLTVEFPYEKTNDFYHECFDLAIKLWGKCKGQVEEAINDIKENIPKEKKECIIACIVAIDDL